MKHTINFEMDKNSKIIEVMATFLIVSELPLHPLC